MALHQGGRADLPGAGGQGRAARSLGNQALILYARGDLDGAMALHKEQERICRELGNMDGLRGPSATRR